MEGINQSQIKPEIGFAFSSGLRALLRQDPDIIMVGEIRDEETASLAIHAALTGHIVLSTLHTSNSIGVIPRLIDMGIQKFLVPPTLNVAMAQRLVRRLCSHCKEKIKAPKKIEVRILEELKQMPEDSKRGVKIGKEIEIYKPKGCKRCNNLGYSGRIGIFEILAMTESLEELIVSKEASETKIAQEAKKQGMITMRQDGILKVLTGLTSFEEILRVAED